MADIKVFQVLLRLRNTLPEGMRGAREGLRGFHNETLRDMKNFFGRSSKEGVDALRKQYAERMDALRREETDALRALQRRQRVEMGSLRASREELGDAYREEVETLRQKHEDEALAAKRHFEGRRRSEEEEFTRKRKTMERENRFRDTAIDHMKKVSLAVKAWLAGSIVAYGMHDSAVMRSTLLLSGMTDQMRTQFGIQSRLLSIHSRTTATDILGMQSAFKRLGFDAESVGRLAQPGASLMSVHGVGAEQVPTVFRTAAMARGFSIFGSTPEQRGQFLTEVSDLLSAADMAGGRFQVIAEEMKAQPDNIGLWVEGLNILKAELGEVSGATERLREKQMKGTGAALERLGKSFLGLSEAIGRVVGPIVEAFANTLAGLFEFLATNPLGQFAATFAVLAVALGGTVGLLLKAWSAFKLLSGITTLATAAQWLFNIAMAANPIGLIILAVAGLIALLLVLAMHWDQVTAAVGAFVDMVVGALMPVIKPVADFFGAVGGAVGGFFGGGQAPVGLADGGIVTRPTPAIIGEGGQPEAVIPLDRLGEFGGGGGSVQVTITGPIYVRDEAEVDAFANVIAKRLLQAMGG